MSGLEVYFWILAMGLCVSLSCAPLGCFLVLRRMSLLGDAVSHAVLPGIALAFIVSGSRNSQIMTVGAALAGFLATAMIERIHSNSPIKQDAAMGIVFTALFALGVVLITVYADKVDLDQECVHYGEITFVALQQKIFGMPEPVFRMLLVMVGVIGLIATFYKELVVASFDADLAQSLGISPERVHYLLMGTLAVTIVSAFEAVGLLCQDGVVEKDGKIELTPKGRPVAEGNVRAHRLWETYMAEVMDIPPRSSSRVGPQSGAFSAPRSGRSA